MRLQCKDAKFVGMLTISGEQFPEWRCPNRKCGMMVAERWIGIPGVRDGARMTGSKID